MSAAKVKSLLGQSLKDATLDAAKLQIKLAKGDEKETNQLTMEVTGPMAAIQKAEVVDAKGESVNNGYSRFGGGGTSTYGLSLGRPLDDTMTLKLTLIIGQKIVDVPLDLKDIPLP